MAYTIYSVRSTPDGRLVVECQTKDALPGTYVTLVNDAPPAESMCMRQANLTVTRANVGETRLDVRNVKVLKSKVVVKCYESPAKKVVGDKSGMYILGAAATKKQLKFMKAWPAVAVYETPDGKPISYEDAERLVS